mmetsp:Transcript_7087/g.16761  ORF Transcript_7087/g.16761 Transcript_7087/m.16761 type:complete len:298 (+) Transcript_7087:105-998(+)
MPRSPQPLPRSLQGERGIISLAFAAAGEPATRSAAERPRGAKRAASCAAAAQAARLHGERIAHRGTCQGCCEGPALARQGQRGLRVCTNRLDLFILKFPPQRQHCASPYDEVGLCLVRQHERRLPQHSQVQRPAALDNLARDASTPLRPGIHDEDAARQGDDEALQWRHCAVAGNVDITSGCRAHCKSPRRHHAPCRVAHFHPHSRRISDAATGHHRCVSESAEHRHGQLCAEACARLSCNLAPLTVLLQQSLTQLLHRPAGLQGTASRKREGDGPGCRVQSNSVQQGAHGRPQVRT